MPPKKRQAPSSDEPAPAKRPRSSAKARQGNPDDPDNPPRRPTEPTGDEPDHPELLRSRQYHGKKQVKTCLDLTLPPMHKLEDIFKDITQNAMSMDFGRVLAHLGSRPLRVATVFSGTESPLLALELVRDILKAKFNLNFEFKHLFSAEIEGFKQAYIERNFHPKYIFRDVNHLKGRAAQTAFGAVEKIPKNPDLLIAGFACVDFSNLNVKKTKKLDKNRESGNTFEALLQYVNLYRPRLVVVENVKMAPWKEIQQSFAGIDYFTVYETVDTKSYYLPQTRERGYMFCVDNTRLTEHNLEGNELNWSDTFKRFKRAASSPAGMFILQENDAKLRQTERDMIERSKSSTRAVVDWNNYRLRHQMYRYESNVGHNRPLTKWHDNGTCQMPDFAWHGWSQSLPARVWDTLDINHLRKVQTGYDMNFKERIIDLSQGVERETDARAPGIIGCITPCGIPYFSTRGGPLCGLEVLALQGLPLDRLLLSRESQNNLQNLAGNAMSSTVVGSAILAALIAGYRVLKNGNLFQAAKSHSSKNELMWPLDDPISWEMPLGFEPLNLFDTDIKQVQEHAASSARYCACEGQSIFNRENIVRCTLCGHTVCAKCKGNPTHSYQHVQITRSNPLGFEKSLNMLLPMAVFMRNMSVQDWFPFHEEVTSLCGNDVWENFLRVVGAAMSRELRLRDIIRGEQWTALYESEYATAKLVISSTVTEWLFFAKPDATEPAACIIREMLAKPIARMKPDQNSLIVGIWHVSCPVSSQGVIKVRGAGTPVESYKSVCGLGDLGPGEEKVHSHLIISAPDKVIRELECDISGEYRLLPNCGTALACLHQRPAQGDVPAVYLFLDPTKIGEASHDSFVFALEHSRKSGYEPRLTIAELSHQWRSSQVGKYEESVNIYYRKWLERPQAQMAPWYPTFPVTCGGLLPQEMTLIDHIDCRAANVTFLSLSMTAAAIPSLWDFGEWKVSNVTDSSALIHDVSWVIRKAATFPGFDEWQQVYPHNLQTDNRESVCRTCAPQKPGLIWVRTKRGQIKPVGDPYSAAVWERQVKDKPSAFLIFRRVDEQGIGRLKISLNVQTLLHEAHGKLARPKAPTDENKVAIFTWRLLTDAPDTRDFNFPKFVLLDNRHDPQAPQPLTFKKPLRPEQLRSLWWMLSREADDVFPFEEVEIAEALFPALQWRAEGRVSVENMVRGGVLADDVGYGKTALVLGLIASQSELYEDHEMPDLTPDGLISSGATLIVVPSHLMHQWKSEIHAFLQDETYTVLTISTVTSLKSKTVRDFQNSDIILVASSIFKDHTSYYVNLEKFTGGPKVPTTGQRNFDAWFEHTMEQLKAQNRLLVNDGVEAVLQSIRANRLKMETDETYCTFAPSKRFKLKDLEKSIQGEERTQRRPQEVQCVAISSGEEDSDSEDDAHDLVAHVRNNLKLLAEESDAEDFHDKDPNEHFQESADESDDEGSTKGADEDVSKKTSQTVPKRDPDRALFNIEEKTEPEKRQSWKTIKPLIHMFSYERVVVDEFPYLCRNRLLPVRSLAARSKWVLSGTPPINDFTDVNQIAPFLNVHLGSEEEASKRDATDAEVFHSYQIPRSDGWHRARHEVAQRFLSHFARKNVPEIYEIRCTEHMVLCRTTSAEQAIYLELYQFLMAHNLQLRRQVKSHFSGDHVQRMNKILGKSESASEALLKLCSSLAFGDEWVNGKPPQSVTCESIERNRAQELEQVKEDLATNLRLAAWLYRKLEKDHAHFQRFCEMVDKHNFGDQSVTEMVCVLIQRTIHESGEDDLHDLFSDPANNDDEDGNKREPRSLGGGKTSKERTGKSKKHKKPETREECQRLLRDLTTTLRELVAEWVQRKRSLRFFTSILQLQAKNHAREVETCEHKWEAHQDGNILGSCGHILCHGCVNETIKKDVCIIEGCRGSGKDFNVINQSSLVRRQDNDQAVKYGGSKLDELITLLSGDNRIPKEDRVILFVQFPEVIEAVEEALKLANIKFTSVKGTAQAVRNKVKTLQERGFDEIKVVILHMGHEMASGLNLQSANHVIFFSPFLAQSKYDYDSMMAQAIGRARRFGQLKHVHVWHLMASMTIDVHIYQERRGGIVIHRNGQDILVDKTEIMCDTNLQHQGPQLELNNDL